MADDVSSIDVPRDWRDEVAGWPHEHWVRWRHLVAELLEGLDDEPTAEDIRAADRLAYDLVTGPSRPHPGVKSSTRTAAPLEAPR